MEKNCGRRREGINQIGCMWVFISIFGSNQKRFLMDMKHGDDEKMQLTYSSESSQDVSIGGDEHVETKVSEEKLSEIIKRLIAQKEGEIQTCKDLLEAFQAMGSEEESLLKNKISHEDAQSLGESKRVEEEKPEAVSKQEAAVVPKKKRKFFSRKWRSEERRNGISQVVVLKPAPNSLDVDSSSSNKSKTGRTFSRFVIGLIKRRLHSAVGKKPCDVLVDRSQNRCVQEEIESNEEADKEDTTVNTSEDSKKTMSGLYVAARKHLSEMLANGDIDVSLSDKEVPRILGKILSLPEFSSPVDSPRLNPPPCLVNPLSQTAEKPKILQCSSCTDSGRSDEDSDKDDETLFTINVLKTEIEQLSETSSSSITQQVEDVDEEDGDKQSSNKAMFNQVHSPPPESPSSSSVRMIESKETATDVQGKLSPVSVLEPLLTDDESSPTTSTRFFSSGEVRIQPLCIRFDEADDSPKPDESNSLKTSMDDKELILAYIEAIVKSSGLSWEELLKKPFYTEQLLEPELADDIVFSSTQLCDDKNLLHDCINEVLMDFCGNELNPGPWISFLKPELQLISDMEIAAKVAQEGVYRHLLPLPSPHTLDQIVKKDMARTGSWMDLRFDIGWIGSGTSEMILDDLIEEIIRSCRDMVQAEQ
ncbi:hypothetical protein N665_0439s0009 [Sinapis alba]|nr:hypothetical protein N665_0439s0009 [Sinapis alba]KAF8091642.1 hypothetical protein N665_0439s0009 [Sinapis alba]KAF8091643.1 hypothetical protein N665_0439s0009 [Sinapis alba]